jgi:hypothetical protein
MEGNMRWSLFILFALPISAGSEQDLFVVDTVGIRNVAIEAAYDANPDLAEGDLIDAEQNQHLILTCPKLDLSPNDYQGEDPMLCRVALRYLIKDTIGEKLVRNPDGACAKWSKFESIHVAVFGDGSTEVNRSPYACASRGSSECDPDYDTSAPTLDFDAWCSEGREFLHCQDCQQE